MAEEKLPAFRTCACGTHGRIVLADGHGEIEVYSQKLARLSLGVALEEGRVAARHLPALRRAIHESGLPSHSEDADEAVCRRVWEWNRAWERRCRDAPEPPCLKEAAS